VIKVDELTRVEGEGGVYLRIKDRRVTGVKFRIFEAPRLFEAFLRGRAYHEAPDITARICGICPVAYQMSSAHAMENAFGIQVKGQLRALRRLLYCGEWIESHGLHIHALHAPDFLGYPDVIQMAKDHPDIVRRGMRLKKIGNTLMTVLGGREIHPINVRVGGFYRVPEQSELTALLDDLKWARNAACETAQWVGSFSYPNFTPEYEFVALHHPSEYPMNEGRLVSSKGLDIAINEYEEYFVEEHVAHSNALHSVLRAQTRPSGAYHVGPLARYNLNYDRLSPLALEAARAANLGKTCLNPFQSIAVRAVETVYACDEAIRIIEAYEPPHTASVKIQARAGIGYGCTEAPRGILYHRYRLDEGGLIRDAKIVPPTSQNQKMIEDELRHFAEQNLDLPDPDLTARCEQVIRNYDPCISCATHFLRIERD
jgi:sulfhydrogenase subunit alpha